MEVTFNTNQQITKSMHNSTNIKKHTAYKCNPYPPITSSKDVTVRNQFNYVISQYRKMIKTESTINFLKIGCYS